MQYMMFYFTYGVFAKSLNAFFWGGVLGSKAMFLLLSPKDASPEVHLEALPELIRTLRETETIERTFNAGSAEVVAHYWRNTSGLIQSVDLILRPHSGKIFIVI